MNTYEQSTKVIEADYERIRYILQIPLIHNPDESEHFCQRFLIPLTKEKFPKPTISQTDYPHPPPSPDTANPAKSKWKPTDPLGKQFPRFTLEAELYVHQRTQWTRPPC